MDLLLAPISVNALSLLFFDRYVSKSNFQDITPIFRVTFTIFLIPHPSEGHK